MSPRATWTVGSRQPWRWPNPCFSFLSRALSAPSSSEWSSRFLRCSNISNETQPENSYESQNAPGLHVDRTYARGGDPRDSRRNRRSEICRTHRDRKSTRLNSSHRTISYAVFCLKKKTINNCDWPEQ